jgi:hypothetical protein
MDVGLNTIPRTAVKATLHGLRLPLVGIETVTGQRGNESWAPAVMFEGFEASAKQLLGSFLRDDELVDEGRVQEARVNALRQSVELEVEAQRIRAEADRELHARRDKATRRREDAEATAARREEAIERDREEQERRVERSLAEQAVAAQQTAEAREVRVEDTERRARLTRVEQEAAALHDESKAVRSTKTAHELADAVDGHKSKRKR